MTEAVTYASRAAVTVRHADRPGLIVALHGLGGTRDQPLALLDGLDIPGYGVLAPDLRAHGETGFTGRPEAFTPARLAADVARLVRDRAPAARPVCVLGISLGATVALELVRSRALDVVGGVFVRPAHHAEPPAHLALNATIAALLRDDPETALERLVASEAYRAVEAVSASGAASLRGKVTGAGDADRWMRLDEGSRWTAFAPDERVDPGVPTLVIGMRDDPLHPVAVAEDWSRRIAGASLVVVPSRDRDPSGAAAGLRAAIQAFLDGVGPRPGSPV